MRRTIKAFADTMLRAGAAGAAPAFTVEKPKATAIPAVDPVPLRSMGRMGAYPRSRRGFQVISSAGLEEVIDEIGKNPPSMSAPLARSGVRWLHRST